VSRFHLKGWPTVSGAQLVALCDLDRERAEHARLLAPDARVYTDAAELFEGEQDLNFVEICTGPESHRELVTQAAGHGVHVLCQKPAALTPPDFREMIEACVAARVRLMIHENWRYRPWYRAMRGEIESRSIGNPLRLRIAHHDTRAVRPDGFVAQPYLGTMPKLILMDMGCHLIDTARYLMGEIETVSATTGRFGRASVGEDVAMLSVAFASGALGLLDFSWCASPDRARPEWALNETVVDGLAGTLRLLTDGSLELVRPSGERELRPVDLPPDDQVYGAVYATVQRHFIEGLLTGVEHETSASDNLKTMEVVWAAYRSAEERRVVEL
jgi:predicted dehydrogenase